MSSNNQPRRILGCLTLLAVAASACSASPKESAAERCGGFLGSVGDVKIGRDEVEAVIANASASGAHLNEAQALKDILWQESERQRLGLPGGADIQQSRREVIRRYRGQRRTSQALDTQKALPPATELTACGTRLIAG
jgi:hypothetical protein